MTFLLSRTSPTAAGHCSVHAQEQLASEERERESTEKARVRVTERRRETLPTEICGWVSVNLHGQISPASIDYTSVSLKFSLF